MRNCWSKFEVMRDAWSVLREEKEMKMKVNSVSEREVMA
jgi:hypothetical protein